MNTKINYLKIFLLQFSAYFLLMHGLKIIFEVSNLKLVELFRRQITTDEIISIIKIDYPNIPSGLVISDFVLWQKTFPFVGIVLAFIIIFVLNYLKNKGNLILTFLSFIFSFIIINFFDRFLWDISKIIFLKPFGLIKNLQLEIILNGSILILISTLLLINSNSRKILNSDD